MDSEKQKAYARRITQANRTELVVITYELIEEELQRAQCSLAACENESFRASVKKAGRFLAELMSSLDYRYSPARSLMSLYAYIQRILVKSELSGQDAGIAEAERIIAALKDSFAKIAPSDDSGAVMENTQTVFAGLTYGRRSLNETDIYTGSSGRGFLA